MVIRHMIEARQTQNSFLRRRDANQCHADSSARFKRQLEK
jgi:hypothetical protein